MCDDSRALTSAQAALFDALTEELLLRLPPGTLLTEPRDIAELLRAEMRITGRWLHWLSMGLEHADGDDEVAIMVGAVGRRLEMMARVGSSD